MARVEEGHGAQPGRESVELAERESREPAVDTFDYNRIPPIPVTHVGEIPVIVTPQPQRFSCATFIVAPLTVTNPLAVQILPQDSMRISALILPADQPIVLCHSREQAQAAQNNTAGLANPLGALIPQGVGVDLDGTDAMWAASAVSTRVSVIIIRRLK